MPGKPATRRSSGRYRGVRTPATPARRRWIKKMRRRRFIAAAGLLFVGETVEMSKGEAGYNNPKSKATPSNTTRAPNTARRLMRSPAIAAKTRAKSGLVATSV